MISSFILVQRPYLSTQMDMFYLEAIIMPNAKQWWKPIKLALQANNENRQCGGVSKRDILMCQNET